MMVLPLRNLVFLLLLSSIVPSDWILIKAIFSGYVSLGYGTVQGKVIDEQGKPVQGVKVYAEPANMEGSSMGKLIFVTTNEHGDFKLEQVLPGENLICTSKEESLYPDTGAAALAVDIEALMRVRVEEGKVSPKITVQIIKGGKLVGSILDDLNDQPLKDSRIRLTRGDDPRLFMSAGPDEQGNFEFVVPSKPFRVEVTASGYKTWRSDDHGGLVLAEPGSTKEFQIRLEKIGRVAMRLSAFSPVTTRERRPRSPSSFPD
jgi:hypothetical protein